MRDILLVSIVIPAALAALRRPWIGVMLWTWLSIMNPHRYTYGFAYSAPLAAIAAGCTLLGLVFTREKQNPFQGVPIGFFACLTAWITISWLMGTDVSGDYEQWSKVIKIYFMTFIALCLLNSKAHIMFFACVTAGSLAFLGAKGGVFTILSGGNYRVWGPPGSFIEDNNHFAVALIMTIPLLYFIQLQITRRWMRLLVTGVMLLCIASALGSHSRGALLAIAAMGSLFWWRSKNKMAIGIMAIVLVLFALPLMPESWWSRMDSIADYEQDASAIGRLNGWHVAFEVAKHHFFGGGMSYQHQIFFTLYGLYNTDVIAAHSIYFQILGNHGFVGLGIYLLMWFFTYSSAGWLRKNARLVPQASWAADLGAMMQVSLVGYAVGGAFLSLPYFDLPYNIMVMVVLARKWVERRAWEKDPGSKVLDSFGFKGLAPPAGAAPETPSPKQRRA